MKTNKIFLFAFIATLFSFIGCSDDTAKEGNALKNYVGLEADKYVGVVLTETVNVEAKIVASEVSNVDRTYPLVVDAATTHSAANYTVPTSVTIPAGSTIGTFTVGITGNNLGSTGKKLVVAIPPQAGLNQNVSYDDPTQTNPLYTIKNNKIIFNIKEVCAVGKTPVTISVKFDNYPEETAWELYNSSNQLIASAGFNAAGTVITGFAALGFADRSTFNANQCLSPGTYTFVIYDKYGDGLADGTTQPGTYSLKLADGTVLASGGGDFGQFEDKTFTIN
jgi:hypothetical protein